ncbi:unnamed protein product [Thlaspi arvense]|uniref:Uncharacterized protein n=1 Tax=Thlaspi arvense TaxID=13288 RepID=A0AAU9STC6_THLAR|nr:unnamed protein product [Thlaspi arvense]
MEKISIKFAFLFFLAVTSVMSIETVKASRLLPEETSQTVLHHEEVSAQVVKPQSLHCKKGCHVQCVPNPFVVECICVC